MKLSPLVLKVAAAVLIVIVIAFRFWHLGSVPSGLNIDEASYGYDAYSLAQTGRDQWGVLLPQLLRSFGDYKPAALSYLIAVLLPFFDLSTLAVRLPSAIAGLLILPFLYLSLEELFPGAKRNFFLTFVFAFSPWAFGISRLFYESNVGLLFYTIAIWLSIRCFHRLGLKSAILIGALFAISGYWYEGLRFTNFFTVGLLVFLMSKQKVVNSKTLIVLSLTYLAINVPLLTPSLTGGLTRIHQENNSQSYGNALFINENRSMCYLSSNKNVIFGQICALWWNKPEERASHIARSLMYQTGPVYLFLRSTQDDIVSPNYGSYLWILFPAYLLGLLVCIKQLLVANRKQPIFLFIILGYVLGCLPGALVGEPMIHRNVAGLYLGLIIIAAGMDKLVALISRHKLPRSIFWLYCVSIMFFISQFITYYFFVYTKLHPEIWHSDSEEIFGYVSAHQNEYSTVYFQGFENAPLYYAFYTKYDPTTYQQYMRTSQADEGGWIHLTKLANLEATKQTLLNHLCARHLQNKDGDNLFIGDPDPQYTSYALMHTYSFRRDYVIHDIYDIDYVYSQIKHNNDFSTICK